MRPFSAEFLTRAHRNTRIHLSYFSPRRVTLTCIFLRYIFNEGPPREMGVPWSQQAGPGLKREADRDYSTFHCRLCHAPSAALQGGSLCEWDFGTDPGRLLTEALAPTRTGSSRTAGWAYFYPLPPPQKKERKKKAEESTCCHGRGFSELHVSSSRTKGFVGGKGSGVQGGGTRGSSGQREARASGRCVTGGGRKAELGGFKVTLSISGRPRLFLESQSPAPLLLLFAF